MHRSLFNKLGISLVTVLVTVSCGWAADLPPERYTEWSTEKDIFVPMRDGTHLDTDVWLPKGATGRLPTVLVSTPYDKDKMEGQVDLGWTEFFARHGYAVVVQKNSVAAISRKAISKTICKAQARTATIRWSGS
jgi:hypothetical protein